MPYKIVLEKLSEKYGSIKNCLNHLESLNEKILEACNEKNTVKFEIYVKSSIKIADDLLEIFNDSLFRRNGVRMQGLSGSVSSAREDLDEMKQSYSRLENCMISSYPVDKGIPSMDVTRNVMSAIGNLTSERSAYGFISKRNPRLDSLGENLTREIMAEYLTSVPKVPIKSTPTLLHKKMNSQLDSTPQFKRS